MAIDCGQCAGLESGGGVGKVQVDGGWFLQKKGVSFDAVKVCRRRSGRSGLERDDRPWCRRCGEEDLFHVVQATQRVGFVL